ncbi:MAG TPA: rRNA maturation RNase YbeY [Acidimicrobiales bacterium]|nr:rRNA maturation RNase YbeY [Acidimicrobiales bacterium]
MGVEVFAADEQSDQAVDPMRWLALARGVLEAEGVKGDAELSLVFVDENAIADLNRRFAGEDGPTDVLSFSFEDEPAPSGRHPDRRGNGPNWTPADAELPVLLGDVYVCPTVAARNAAEHAGTYEDELALLVVHGILHLLGRDHVVEAEAEAMERREQELLAELHRKQAVAADGTSA